MQNPDGAWIYVIVDVTAAIINAGDPIPLPDPAEAPWFPGTWEFLNVNVSRTAGAAAATYNPKLKERTDPASKYVFADLGNGIAIANPVIKPQLNAVFKCEKTQAPAFYPQPNVGGDTFNIRALVRKRL
jgi:hypothetical protein